MPTYEWKARAVIPIDPQVAGKRLEELATDLGGVTPADVVADATPAGSVLHPGFEWNDAQAARAHREDQARHMLRSIQVVIERPDADDDDPIVTRGFVVIERDGSGRVYEQVQTVMSDAALRQQVVARAWRELAEWKARYSSYVELSNLYAAIEDAQRRRKRPRRPPPDDRPPT